MRRIEVDDREYGNEEFPTINRVLFDYAKRQVRTFFEGLLRFISEA